MLNLSNKSSFFFECLPSYENGYLKVGNNHSIYFEQYGNPKGIPILFLHGGPGAGFSNAHKSFFDPKIFRVVFFDQRGSGKSIPYAETNFNNTQLLISDIEDLRKLLKIDKWYLFGGSWGSTLALLYGIEFPNRCMGFILRGIFLGTKIEINWFLYDIKKFFPEAYNKFMSSIPEDKRNDILEWFYKQLHSNNRSQNLKAASVWAEYENSCSSINYSPRPISGEQALAISKIETHYFMNDCFIEDNYIIKNLNKISNIKSFIVQGRYDVICPPFTALKLADCWNAAKIEVVDDAGHSGFETNISKKLVNALQMIK
jgi:proline iminopeptidase